MAQRRKLYDGLSDDFRIQGGRIYHASSHPHATLAALQWAAERANLSYGVFTLNLTEDDQKCIQAEYEAYQRERKNELAARPCVNIGAVDKEILDVEIDDGDIDDR